LYSSGKGLHGIIEDQFYLAHQSNISVSESQNMADFEREAYVSLLIRHLEQEAKSYQKNNKSHA